METQETVETHPLFRRSPRAPTKNAKEGAKGALTPMKYTVEMEPCLYCGHDNHPTSFRCQKCGGFTPTKTGQEYDRLVRTVVFTILGVVGGLLLLLMFLG